jgi:hypothetical protein
MFNIYLGLYIIAAIFTIAGGSYKIYDMNNHYGALLFFAGSLTAFIIYGLRWFAASNAIFSPTPGPWPPTINSCPDYLTAYTRKMPDGTTQSTCIDLLGVSKNGALKMFVEKGEPPASDEYYFSLETKSTDAAGRNAELCQRTMTFGLTWEGITNGESCMSPDGSVNTGGSGGSAACPTAH